MGQSGESSGADFQNGVARSFSIAQCKKPRMTSWKNICTDFYVNIDFPTTTTHLNDAYFECFCDTRLYYADISICSCAQQIWLDLLWHIQLIGMVSFWLCLFTHKRERVRWVDGAWKQRPKVSQHVSPKVEIWIFVLRRARSSQKWL